MIKIKDMRKIKKIWLGILTILAVIGTYIGINQLTDRDSDSYTPPPRKPPVRTQGGATRKDIQNPPQDKVQ